MTIAACHLSPEGVVLGADSTSTISFPDGSEIYLDHAQKIFEVGREGSSIGLVTWGCGQIGSTSHRLIAAQLGSANIQHGSMKAIAEAAGRLADAAMLELEPLKKLRDKVTDAGGVHAYLDGIQDEASKNLAIQQFVELHQQFGGGYIIGGRTGEGLTCEAWRVTWSPLDPPLVSEVPSETPIFFGVPWIMERLIYGSDSRLLEDIYTSGKWGGTFEELSDILMTRQLMWPRLLPIREAVDWIHTVIHLTIKGLKFMQAPHHCGGAVELAVVTCDRPFRWVCHKPMGSAIITAQENSAPRC